MHTWLITTHKPIRERCVVAIATVLALLLLNHINYVNRVYNSNLWVEGSTSVYGYELLAYNRQRLVDLCWLGQLRRTLKEIAVCTLL